MQRCLPMRMYTNPNTHTHTHIHTNASSRQVRHDTDDDDDNDDDRGMVIHPLPHWHSYTHAHKQTNMCANMMSAFLGSTIVLLLLLLWWTSSSSLLSPRVMHRLRGDTFIISHRLCVIRIVVVVDDIRTIYVCRIVRVYIMGYEFWTADCAQKRTLHLQLSDVRNGEIRQRWKSTLNCRIGFRQRINKSRHIQIHDEIRIIGFIFGSTTAVSIRMQIACPTTRHAKVLRGFLCSFRSAVCPT